MSFVVTSSSALVKPPLLDKNDAIRLWFANRRLNQTTKAAIQRKDQYKASAASAARRCTELEARLVEIERRATAAESRVEQLNRELMKCESQAATQALIQAQAHGQTAPRLIRQRLLGLVRRFHPDRTKTTTPDEVTKALNGLVEEMDASFNMLSSWNHMIYTAKTEMYFATTKRLAEK